MSFYRESLFYLAFVQGKSFHKRESGSHLSGHGVGVEDGEDQSQDGSIEETKVRLEDDAVEGRGGRCQEVHLVSKTDPVSKF